MTKGSEPYWELSGHSPVNTCNTKPNEAEKPVEAQLTFDRNPQVWTGQKNPNLFTTSCSST